jgi:AcrR family transcriptional regulator
MHPTKRLLVDTVENLLKEVTSEKITIEQVLEKSGISRGSLYHHFEDFNELIEIAEIEEYSGLITESINGLVAILQTAQSRDELVHMV